jgi:hypothetical protein
MKTRKLDIINQIQDITEDDVRQRLKELSGTHFWPAILKYFDSRSAFVEGALRTIDPFKEPTQVARNQGTLMGIGDLEEAVNLLLNEEKQQKEDEKAKEVAE